MQTPPSVFMVPINTKVMPFDLPKHDHYKRKNAWYPPAIAQDLVIQDNHKPD